MPRTGCLLVGLAVSRDPAAGSLLDLHAWHARLSPLIAFRTAALGRNSIPGSGGCSSEPCWCSPGKIGVREKNLFGSGLIGRAEVLGSIRGVQGTLGVTDPLFLRSEWSADLPITFSPP